MPTSHPSIISPVAQKILELKPKTVLDIGVGFGKWGALAREYTDIWAWRFYRNEWRTQIDGIEVHKEYKSPNWDNYNRICIGLAETILPTLETYDLIIFLEVLEHIDKATALEFLKEVFKHTKIALISYTNSPQSNVRDNDYEEHVSTWEQYELEQFGTVELLHKFDETYVYLVTSR